MKFAFCRYCLIVLFVGLLFFPMADNNWEWTKLLTYYSENRPLAEKPVLDLANIDSFPARYQRYYTDHLRLRGQMIKHYNKLCMYVFDKSPLPDLIVVGKSDWLFMADTDLNIFRGTDLFTESELEVLLEEFEYRRKYLEERNCKFYIGVVPSKTRIYPEYMPENIDRLDTVSYSTQLITYLREHSAVNVIDLYPVLKRKKEQRRIYFKTDNHWNRVGAYYGSQAIIQEMKKDFPNLPGVPEKLVEIDSAETYGGHMAILLSVADELKEMDYSITFKKGVNTHEGEKKFQRPSHYTFQMEYEVVREQPDKSLPKIVVIRDSFGSSFILPFSESFHKSVYILDNWEYKLNENIIESEKPDAVLLLIYEPLLKNIRWNLSKEKIYRNVNHSAHDAIKS